MGLANVFLAALNEKQRDAVLYKFNDEEQRARWSNLPTGFVPRGGLSLEELSDTQQKAALALVASTLSQKGYQKGRGNQGSRRRFQGHPASASSFREQ